VSAPAPASTPKLPSHPPITFLPSPVISSQLQANHHQPFLSFVSSCFFLLHIHSRSKVLGPRTLALVPRCLLVPEIRRNLLIRYSYHQLIRYHIRFNDSRSKHILHPESLDKESTNFSLLASIHVENFEFPPLHVSSAHGSETEPAPDPKSAHQSSTALRLRVPASQHVAATESLASAGPRCQPSGCSC
jgi:hypothetical protein